jgi:hypothetical protein
MRIGLSALTLIIAAAPAVSEAELLRLDGFESGSMVAFQGGFEPEEVAAVRLVPTVSCPCQVDRILLLFGGSDETRVIELYIWEDASGSLDPGTELFAGGFQLAGSNSNLQEIDLSGENVVVTGPFRVGVRAIQGGFPFVARDADGTIDSSNNFIFGDPGGVFGFSFWFGSADAGVTGDWIIRAEVVSSQNPDADGDGVPDAEDNCPSVANGPDQAEVPGVGNQTDSGGIASPADPSGAVSDGIGDACTCGDVSGDGKVLGNDATLIRRFLLALSVPASFRVSHCNVAGPAGSSVDQCQGNDATVIRRALLGLEPGVTAGLCLPPSP